MDAVDPGWLGDDLVYAVVPSLSDVDFLCVARTSDDVRLDKVVDLGKLSYPPCCLDAVHDGHALVHQDETVSATLLDSTLELIHGLLTVVTVVNQLVQDLGVKLQVGEGFLEKDHQTLDVEGFVVDHQNSLAAVVLHIYHGFSSDIALRRRA